MWLFWNGIATLLFGVVNVSRDKCMDTANSQKILPTQLIWFLLFAQVVLGGIILMWNHVWKGVPLPPLSLFPWFVLSGWLYALALLSYFFALTKSGVTVTAPLFTLTIPFTALLGWIFLEEVLGLRDGIGCGLLWAGCLLICWKGRKGFHAAVLGLMVLNSLLFAVYLCFLRWFGTAHQLPSDVIFSWTRVGFIPLPFFLLAWESMRRSVKSITKFPTSRRSYLLANEFLNGFGILAAIAAVVMGPSITVVKATFLSLLQVTFFGFAFLYSRIDPSYAEGRIDHIRRKLFGMALILVGVWLTST